MIIYHICCIGHLSNLHHLDQSEAVIFHSHIHLMSVNYTSASTFTVHVNWMICQTPCYVWAQFNSLEKNINCRIKARQGCMWTYWLQSKDIAAMSTWHFLYPHPHCSQMDLRTIWISILKHLGCRVFTWQALGKLQFTLSKTSVSFNSYGPVQIKTSLRI